jgi:hypothetical protein
MSLQWQLARQVPDDTARLAKRFWPPKTCIGKSEIGSMNCFRRGPLC